MVEIKSHFKLFFGVLFVIFGLIGVFDWWGFFSVELPWQVWPIGVIMVGVLFMLNRKDLAFVCVGLLLVLGVFSAGLNCCEKLNMQNFEREFELNDSDVVDLDLSYGMGEVVLSKGEDSDKISFSGTTFSSPAVKESLDGKVKRISVSRDSDEYGIMEGGEWAFELGDDVIYNLKLEYGVSDVELDLRGLRVDRLDIGQGVSDTRIIFGTHSTEAFIEGGVSDFDFEFDEYVSVVIYVDGGLLDVDFEGFEKRDGAYYSEGFDAKKGVVSVRFNGGVSDLSSEFY